MDYAKLETTQKAELITKYLKEDYPSVSSPLYHRNVWEFLIAVMLSPQTNDDTTNKVTPILFERFDTPEKLADAEPEEVMVIIRSINYYKTKAARIISTSKMILEEFEGKVPHKMEDMLKLPGVGRKVANVILNDWYATPLEGNPLMEMTNTNEQPHPNPLQNGEGEKDSNLYNSVPRGSVEPTGFVVDTHVLRISQALKLTDHKTPEKVEKDLMEIFPKKEWMGTSLRMIFHGREVFQAKKPEFKNFPKWKEIYESLGY